MANGILDALSKHSMFSETLDTLNRDPSTAHQMKGFDFAQNFPGAVPGGINTPASFVGPMLSKGYQYGQELSRAMLDGLGGITIGDALSKAKTQSDANIEGMLGKGFDINTYNQNVQDFNIADVNFANSFGLADLFGSSAMANEPMSIEDFSKTITPMAKPNVVDLNRIPGRIQEAVKPQKGITTLRDKLESLKAKGIDLGRMALSGIGRFAAGPVGGIVGSLIGGLANQFENRPLGANVIDEFGNVYDFNELNKQNALGGYYTDPARSARRRTRRIANLLERQKLKKNFSLKNLAKLQAQERAQEKARREATRSMAAQNKADGKGGYQSDYAKDTGFMEGPNTSRGESFSDVQGST